MTDRAKAGWREIDAASPEAAHELLRRACGSCNRGDRMIRRWPRGTDLGLRQDARDEWFALTEDDWLEAFWHHPKIGDRSSLEERFPKTHDLSEQEQAGVATAREDVLEALAQDNATYHQRYGFIFIVCATGKSADEI